MDGYVPLLMFVLGGSLTAGIALSALTSWAVWPIVMVILVAVFAIAALIPPLEHALEFGFWTALVASVPALGGTAIGRLIKRKRLS